jgi:hypothetical protein
MKPIANFLLSPTLLQCSSRQIVQLRKAKAVKQLIALSIALFCAGCVSVPIVAKTSTGEKFVGSATATHSERWHKV